MNRTEAQLEELTAAVRALPEREHTVPPTLEVLGRERDEGAWQALLTHFISPQNHPHGRELLAVFLETLGSQTPYPEQFTAESLEGVQLAMETDADSGRPDLLIWKPDAWFYCLELKVGATEHDEQTTKYANSTSLGPITTETYAPENRRYVYLADPIADPPSSPTFEEVGWGVVRSAFIEYYEDTNEELTSRVASQLDDFLETMGDAISLDLPDQTREAAKLAVRYSPVLLEADARTDNAHSFETEAVESVREALDTLVSMQRRRWQSDFRSASPADDQTWQTHHQGEKYCQIYRRDWVSGVSSSAGRPRPKVAENEVFYQFVISSESYLRGELMVKLKLRGAAVDDVFQNEAARTAFDTAVAETSAENTRTKSVVHDLELVVPLNVDGAPVGHLAAEAIEKLQPVTSVLEKHVTPRL